VQAGTLRRGTGETIRAVLLSADLRDFTALSEATEPAAMIAALDAWFERVAGAVHAFGGEVLKFIGDGVLAIFPVAGSPAAACEAALRAIVAARAGMAHLDAARQAQGLPGRCRSARRCIWARYCGAISARPTGWTSPPSDPRSTWSAGWRGYAGRSADRC
jgi:class 3 adenylate cyclase